MKRLIDDQGHPVSRFGWKHGVVRCLVVVWTCGAVAYGTLGGNHEVPTGFAANHPVNLFDLLLLGFSNLF